MSNGYSKVPWQFCAHCRTPYEAKDLHEVTLTRWVCRWHYARGER